jgi:hypothetical protein
MVTMPLPLTTAVTVYLPPGSAVNKAFMAGVAVVTEIIVGLFVPLAAPLQVTKWFFWNLLVIFHWLV